MIRLLGSFFIGFGLGGLGFAINGWFGAIAGMALGVGFVMFMLNLRGGGE